MLGWTVLSMSYINHEHAGDNVTRHRTCLHYIICRTVKAKIKTKSPFV